MLTLALWLAVGSLAMAADGDSTVSATRAAAPGGPLEAILFYVIAAAVVVSALGVCISRNIVRMAVWLFVTLGSVALLYFLLAATFIGAIQLMVYAGGTLVLLVFGIMLTSKSPWAKFGVRIGELTGAAVVCVGLFLALTALLLGGIWSSVADAVPGASIRDFGRALMTDYLVPFEMAGVVLMIVMVGAAHLARQEK